MNNLEFIKSIDEMLIQRYQDSTCRERWEGAYINQQIQKRKAGKENFTLNEHIEAMVLSMLSSGTSWHKIDQNISKINKIFCGFDSKGLINKTPEELTNEIYNIKCGSTSTKQQMKVLKSNILTLQKIENQYGSIDKFYLSLISEDNEYHPCVPVINMLNNVYKLKMMGIALIAEYLRNLGYDMTKPDRHIKRLFGKGYLEEYEINNDSEEAAWLCFKIVKQYAVALNWEEARVDHVLWNFCAKGYLEICTKKSPKCDKCPRKQTCPSSIYQK